MRKIRIISIVLSFICIMGLLTGCAEERNEKLPKLVIGCDDYEPYNYTDEDGEPVGLDVDLAKEACSRMGENGYEPVFKKIDWNERDTILQNGEADCLWSCYSMDGQEDKYAWVGPYMHTRQVAAVLEDSQIYSLDDLEGKKVAVRVGSKAEAIFLDHTDADIPHVKNVYSLNSPAEVATALRNDYVDAAAGYAATLRETLQSDGVRFRFLDNDLSKASFGIAFALNSDRELKNELSDALDDMLSDGTVKRILEEYGVDTDKALGGIAGE